MKAKVSVTVSQRRDGENKTYYIVTKVVNSTSPRIGEILDPEQADALIAQGVTLTVVA